MIYVIQDSIRWLAIVHMIMNHRVL